MPKNLISIQDFSKEEILHILSVAREFEAAREQGGGLPLFRALYPYPPVV